MRRTQRQLITNIPKRKKKVYLVLLTMDVQGRLSDPQIQQLVALEHLIQQQQQQQQQNCPRSYADKT